jgi:hypothetical protein
MSAHSLTSAGSTVLVSTTIAPSPSCGPSVVTTEREVAGVGNESTTTWQPARAASSPDNTNPCRAAASARRSADMSNATTSKVVASRPAMGSPIWPSPTRPTLPCTDPPTP